MNAFKTLFIGAALTATLAACKKEEETPIKPIVAPPRVAESAAAAKPAVSNTATSATAAAFPPDIAVQTVTLGNAVGPDNKVTTPSASFAPKDTIYAAVLTKNPSTGAVLEAKWTFQDGQMVHDDSVTIAPKTDAVTDFHISSPKGLPVGTYQLAVSLNGQQVNSAAFEVKDAAPPAAAATVKK